jgi:pimeloyl-ACP methyl ester carboxylesterase
LSNRYAHLLATGLVVLGSIACVQGPSAQARTSGTARQCGAMAKFAVPGVEITGATLVPAAAAGTVKMYVDGPDVFPVALPPHCRVEGMINRRMGAGGKEYGIGFALALPVSWNGRFLYQGGGGFNGSVRNPYGIAATAGNPALARGFAVISSDSGHKGAPFDVSFMADQQAAIDFGFASVPAVTRVGKDLTTHYYGKAPHHNYAAGCSTGGREAMSAMQRYPDLFDGVIAGAPAMRTAHTRIGSWNARVAFNRIAPRDAAGNPLVAEAFPAADQRLLYDAVAGRCDALDGLKDGMIFNSGACRFDPAVLQCTAGKQPGCLSEGQVGALRIAFAGPRDANGKAIYAGFTYDLGLMGEAVANPVSIVPGAGFNPFGSPPSPLEFDFATELDRMSTNALQLLTDTRNWVDLGSFYRRGGKVLFFNGASDPWYSMSDTLGYFRDNRAANPEFDSSRFYSIPNMGHCDGGGVDSFDLLGPLVDWVENGVAPPPIRATSRAQPQVSRPLCPWPQYARYKGAGDVDRAESFECVSDSDA